jgi:hypothetical protein
MPFMTYEKEKRQGVFVYFVFIEVHLSSVEHLGGDLTPICRRSGLLAWLEIFSQISFFKG